MLQQEVAQRLWAEPGSKRYGRLSVLAQWQCEVYPVLDVPPESFTPPPKVMSSVVRLQPRAQPAFVAEFVRLEALLGAAFGQRRKMLRSALKGWVAEPEAVLQAAGIDPTRRAETLHLAEFGALLKAAGQGN
jgi:16S rRNA (adenine1518-N6/adenine1519-N6)-dimethyltransferase